MNSELLLKALNKLAGAIELLGYHTLQNSEDKYALSGILADFQTIAGLLHYEAKNQPAKREQLINIINEVVDENQTLGAEEIADAIIEKTKN